MNWEMSTAEWVIAVSSAITGIATAFIACYGRRSHQLTLQLKATEEQRSKREEEFRQQLSDLYQAIVIATLLSGNSNLGALVEAKLAFEGLYKGKTKIF